MVNFDLSWDTQRLYTFGSGVLFIRKCLHKVYSGKTHLHQNQLEFTFSEGKLFKIRFVQHILGLYGKYRKLLCRSKID